MTTEGIDPLLPPLFSGVSVEGSIDPFNKAMSLAALGCDAGTLVHNVSVDRLRAAVVFGPEVPLEDAMAMLPACGVGFANALGALAPPEVAVHLEWTGPIRVNGALCGRLRASASTSDPGSVPNWLVIGLDVPFIMDSEAPGLSPDRTVLYQEGCGDIDPVSLLESWSRHTLVWVNRWFEDGNRPLHAEWRTLVHGMGEDVTLTVDGETVFGTFLGTDERFGLLLRQNGETRLLPLSGLLQ